MSDSEYGKLCGLCRKRKESRIFFARINNKYIKLCKECWEEQLKKLGE